VAQRIHDRQPAAIALFGHALILGHAGNIDGQRDVDCQSDVRVRTRRRPPARRRQPTSSCTVAARITSYFGFFRFFHLDRDESGHAVVHALAGYSSRRISLNS